MSDLEAQVAAVKAERERAQAERDKAAKDKRLAAELARQKQALVDDAKYAELVEVHGDDALTRINTKRGMVVVKAADPLVHRRFTDAIGRSDHPNPKVRTSMHDEAERMVRFCLVYPTREEFDAIAKEVPGLIGIAANEAYELGKPQVEEDAGKFGS